MAGRDDFGSGSKSPGGWGGSGGGGPALLAARTSVAGVNSLARDERGVVYLHMQGACAGCPSSTMTLKMGIENLLRHYIPEVTEVRPVAV